MLELFKKHKSLILVSIIAIVTLYLTQDYYKKTESYKESIKKELDISYKEKEELKQSISSLKIEINKLESEVKKKNKKTTISITKNADGSSKKDILIDESESSEKIVNENNKLEENKETNIKITDLEYKLKENENSYKEYKLEEEKRSNRTILYFLGAAGVGFIACSITKKCGIIKIP